MVRMARNTLGIALALALGSSAALPGPALGTLPVGFKLQSPQNGATVAPGQIVKCNVRVFVNSADNQGLALALVDLVQDPGNPELFDLPPTRAQQSMASFDRPLGFANPDPLDPEGSAFGGTQVGPPGRRNLVQIGGAQNTFGQPGPCTGPNQDLCVGQRVNVDASVGHGFTGQLLATVRFPAPATPGTYVFRLENAAASVLEQVNVPPAASVVKAAPVNMNQTSIVFTVQ